MNNEIMIDASKLSNLSNNKLFVYVTEFLNGLDTMQLDNHYAKVIEDLPNEKLGKVFDILSKVYFYVSFLIFTKYPDICRFKIINHYIANERVILKVAIKEL